MFTPTLTEREEACRGCVSKLRLAPGVACARGRAVCDSRSEAVAADRAHRRAAAAVTEERERIDCDARGANLFEHGPERLRHAFEMGRFERPGERDREAVCAIVVVRGGHEVRERRHTLRDEPIEPGR